MRVLAGGFVVVFAGCSTAPASQVSDPHADDITNVTEVVVLQPSAPATPPPRGSAPSTPSAPVVDELDRGPICVAHVFHCNCSMGCTQAASMRELMSQLDCKVECGEDLSQLRCGFVDGLCTSL